MSSILHALIIGASDHSWWWEGLGIGLVKYSYHSLQLHHHNPISSRLDPQSHPQFYTLECVAWFSYSRQSCAYVAFSPVNNFLLRWVFMLKQLTWLVLFKLYEHFVRLSHLCNQNGKYNCHSLQHHHHNPIPSWLWQPLSFVPRPPHSPTVQICIYTTVCCII